MVNTRPVTITMGVCLKRCSSARSVQHTSLNAVLFLLSVPNSSQLICVWRVGSAGPVLLSIIGVMDVALLDDEYTPVMTVHNWIRRLTDLSFSLVFMVVM